MSPPARGPARRARAGQEQPGAGRRTTRAAGFLSRLALLLTLALAAGSARPAAGGEPSPGGPSPRAPQAASPAVRLSWIGHWLGEDRREQLVREIKKEYEFLHPDVTVDLVFNKELPGPEPDHKRKAAAAVVSMIRTGRIDWDIVNVDIAVYEFVAEALGDPRWTAKHLVDFSGVPGFAESQEEFIMTDPRYKARMGGIYTGPFTENYLHTLWYNTEVARRAGIAVKERGMTFEDFRGYAEQLARHNRERGTAVAFLKLGSWNRIDALFEHLFKSAFDDFEAAVAPRFSAEKGRALLRTLEAFEQVARYQPVVNAGWEQLPTNDFLSGFLLRDDALFVLGGTFMYSQFRGVSIPASTKARPVENPYLKRPNGLVGDYTPVFAVMKNSPHRDAAVDLLMSWTYPRNADKWVRYTKNLSGTRSFITNARAGDADAFGDIYERFLVDMKRANAGLPVLHFRTPTYVFGERTPVSVVELRSRLAAILEGKLTARGYYDDVMRRVRADD